MGKIGLYIAMLPKMRSSDAPLAASIPHGLPLLATALVVRDGCPKAGTLFTSFSGSYFDFFFFFPQALVRLLPFLSDMQKVNLAAFFIPGLRTGSARRAAGHPILAAESLLRFTWTPKVGKIMV